MSLKADAAKAALTLGARHWRLWEWINGKLSRILSKRQPHRPESLQDLWKSIYEGQIKDGDYVELRMNPDTEIYWYIQEWVPRAPGRLWLEDGLFSIPIDKLSNAFDHRTCPPGLVDLRYCKHDHWETQIRGESTFGKSLYNQGFTFRMGIYRPPLSIEVDRYALLGLVTAKEYFIDLSFPILVSREVYRKFVEAQVQNNAVEIEAILEISEVQLSDPFKAYVKAVNSLEYEGLSELINTQIGTKSISGHISFPLDITIKTHLSHPSGTIRVEGFNMNEFTRQKDGIVFIARSAIWNPSDLPTVLTEEEFLLGEDRQFGTIIHPVTDFDARVRRFQSDAPVEINPKIQPEVMEKFKSPF